MDGFRVSVVFLASAAVVMAADLNLTIQSGESSTIMVGPGETVDYVVIGQLSSAKNDGLAMFAFDLEFSGGPLQQADPPSGPPMDRFANDQGISNPAGFGGTVIEGVLVQVGGAQNTIKNTLEYAPYPIGEVLTGVGHDAVVLVTGSLVAPEKPGVYTLQADNIVANVIKPGQDPEGQYWQVEVGPQGAVVALTIEVTDIVPVAIVGSVPPSEAIDARQPSDVNGEAPGGWDAVLLTFSGDPSGTTADDFEIAVSDGDAPGIDQVAVDGQDVTVTFSEFIPTAAWTTVTHTPSATSVRLGFLPADVNGDRHSSPLDILDLIDGLNEVQPLETWQSDINRSGVFEPSDILAVIDLLNGAGAHESWNGRTLPD